MNDWVIFIYFFLCFFFLIFSQLLTKQVSWLLWASFFSSWCTSHIPVVTMVTILMETKEVSHLRNYECFHLVSHPGNFVLKSNGKVRFSSVRLECSGPPTTLTARTEIWLTGSRPTFFFGRFHLFTEFGKEIKKTNGKGHSSWLAQFDRKMSFHFSLGFPTGLRLVCLAWWKHPIL